MRAALGAADVAAVLLRLAPADERTLIKRVKALAPIVQKRARPLILDGHPASSRARGADGAHLTGIAAFEDAVAALKPDRIAGAGGLVTRHDAMLAAEPGADYVLFGEPDEDGERPAFDDRHRAHRLVGGGVRDSLRRPLRRALDEIAPLCAAGADFVALGDFGSGAIRAAWPRCGARQLRQHLRWRGAAA